MTNHLSLAGSNTILYCRKWPETVAFYQDILELQVTFATDWFVEFQLVGAAHLSIADERRATVKSNRGAGITLTFKVESVDETWNHLRNKGLAVGPIRDHPWAARTFFLYDPEGHRLEFWSDRSR
ncbi:MAG: VOC family protein [Anaerolineae bacterium]|nr:VOC family protein [Anaerolineae bacterium]